MVLSASVRHRKTLLLTSTPDLQTCGCTLLCAIYWTCLAVRFALNSYCSLIRTENRAIHNVHVFVWGGSKGHLLSGMTENTLHFVILTWFWQQLYCWGQSWARDQPFNQQGKKHPEAKNPSTISSATQPPTNNGKNTQNIANQANLLFPLEGKSCLQMSGEKLCRV